MVVFHMVAYRQGPYMYKIWIKTKCERVCTIVTELENFAEQ